MAQNRRRSIIFQNSAVAEEIVENAETKLESIPVDVEIYLNKVENEYKEWKEICKKMRQKDKTPYLEPSKFDFKSHLTHEELEYLKQTEEFGKKDIAESKKVLKQLGMVERLTKQQTKTVKSLFKGYEKVINMAQTEFIMKKLDNYCPTIVSTEKSENQDDESFLYLEGE